MGRWFYQLQGARVLMELLMNKLKKRWGIESNLQFAIILTVFAITGTAAARCAAPVAAALGITSASTPIWIQWPLQVILILPLYQVLLLLIGAAFGQHRFFWAFEKRMLASCGLSYFATVKSKHGLKEGADRTEQQDVEVSEPVATTTN